MGNRTAETFRDARYAVLDRSGTGPDFSGWSDGSLRDGWEAPLFGHREAERVLDHYWRALGWAYDGPSDMFVLNAPPGTDEEFLTVAGRWIRVARGRRRVYDVGWGWPWVETG